MDDFSSGLAGDGPVHLVLHGLEKGKAGFSRRIVVNTGSVDVGDLFVKATLGGADILNPPRKLFEIIEGLIRVFEPFIVEHKAFNDIFVQTLGCPDAKPCSNNRFDTVTYRNNGIKVIEVDGSIDLPGTFLANC